LAGRGFGGGLALAAAALAGSVCSCGRTYLFGVTTAEAVALALDPPYTEIADFLRASPELEQQAFRSLSYFDVVHHAARVGCPATLTVGLFDTVYPRNTIFGAFQRLNSRDKKLQAPR